jgi:ATP-dependent protease HslVU (ClpYQ) ATPase subunit
VLLASVLASLLALDFEGHVLAGLKTMTAVLVLFGKDVREILRTPVGAGVDLSREERVEKCRVFHLAMEKAEERVQKLGQSRAFRGSAPVHAAVEKAQRELVGYLKM